jgi:hypothetical protein
MNGRFCADKSEWQSAIRNAPAPIGGPALPAEHSARPTAARVAFTPTLAFRLRAIGRVLHNLRGNAPKPPNAQEGAMTPARFVFSGKTIALPNGRVIVSASRMSSARREKKYVCIEVECKPDEVETVQKALAVILERHGRIDTSAF